jgi:hypothetical protein
MATVGVFSEKDSHSASQITLFPAFSVVSEVSSFWMLGIT